MIEVKYTFNLIQRSKDDGNRQLLEKFKKLHFRNPIRPKSIQAGFVLVNLDEDFKAVDIDLLSRQTVKSYSFIFVDPDFRADHKEVDFETLYAAESRPHIAAKFSAPIVNLENMGIYPETPPETATAAAQSKPHQSAYLFDDTPLPLEALKAFDLDIALDADQLVARHITINDLDLDIRFKTDGCASIPRGWSTPPDLRMSKQLSMRPDRRRSSI